MFGATLQDTFYIVGIIFMVSAITLLVMIAVIALVVWSKINSLQKNIKHKIDLISSIPKKGKGFMSGFKSGMSQG